MKHEILRQYSYNMYYYSIIILLFLKQNKHDGCFCFLSYLKKQETTLIFQFISTKKKITFNNKKIYKNKCLPPKYAIASVRLKGVNILSNK